MFVFICILITVIKTYFWVTIHLKLLTSQLLLPFQRCMLCWISVGLKHFLFLFKTFFVIDGFLFVKGLTFVFVRLCGKVWFEIDRKCRYFVMQLISTYFNFIDFWIILTCLQCNLSFLSSIIFCLLNT